MAKIDFQLIKHIEYYFIFCASTMNKTLYITSYWMSNPSATFMDPKAKKFRIIAAVGPWWLMEQPKRRRISHAVKTQDICFFQQARTWSSLNTSKLASPSPCQYKRRKIQKPDGGSSNEKDSVDEIYEVNITSMQKEQLAHRGSHMETAYLNSEYAHYQATGK